MVRKMVAKEMMIRKINKNTKGDFAKMSGLDQACFLLVVRKFYRDKMSNFICDYLPKELDISNEYKLTAKGVSFLAKAKNNMTTKNINYEDIFGYIEKINEGKTSNDVDEFKKYCMRRNETIEDNINEGYLNNQEDVLALTFKGRYKLLTNKTNLIYANCMLKDSKEKKEEEKVL